MDTPRAYLEFLTLEVLYHAFNLRLMKLCSEGKCKMIQASIAPQAICKTAKAQVGEMAAVVGCLISEWMKLMLLLGEMDCSIGIVQCAALHRTARLSKDVYCWWAGPRAIQKEAFG